MGLEPTTTGITILSFRVSPLLSFVDTIYINQQLSVIYCAQSQCQVLIDIHHNSAKVATWWLHGNFNTWPALKIQAPQTWTKPTT
jgi:hypothetical protein